MKWILGILAVLSSLLLVFVVTVPADKKVRLKEGRLITQLPDGTTEEIEAEKLYGPGSTAKHGRYLKDEIYFEEAYNFDKFGRRSTPSKENNFRKHFVAIFGGSIAFGYGLPDHHTVATHLGTHAPAFRPYNYARLKSGTNHLLAMLQERDLRKEIPQKRGFGIYLWTKDQLRISIGDAEESVNNRDAPWFNVTEDIVTREGTLGKGRGFVTWLHRFKKGLDPERKNS